MIATCAVRAELSWGLRAAILGTYSGTGGMLGAIASNISAKRRAGPILVTLGTVIATGFKIVSAVAVSLGILSVAMQSIDTHRSGPELMSVGHALMFTTFGIQAVMITTTRWVLADQGIVGPNVFVPWKQALAWDWQDPNTLAIAIKPGLLGARKFRIPVDSDARDEVAAVLASKIP
jgi:hypothetical protein